MSGLDKKVRNFAAVAHKKRKCSECARLRRRLAPLLLDISAQLQALAAQLQHGDAAIELLRQQEAESFLGEWLAEHARP